MGLRDINRFLKIGITFFVIVFFLSGCISGIVKVTGVAIVGGNRVLKVGETLQLSARIEPADATNTTVFWESSDVSKVTVDDKGLIKAIAMPGAEITVITKDGEFEANIAIAVIETESNNPDNQCNTCDPCDPCNPCNTSDSCNQCNPCDPCNPCNQCNPCDSDPCNPCNTNNPCNQCNTCEPEPCDPCNPNGDCYNPCECQSNPCNPCNPCN